MKELQVDYFSVVFSGLKSNYQNTVKYVENVSLQHFIWFGKQKMQLILKDVYWLWELD